MEQVFKKKKQIKIASSSEKYQLFLVVWKKTKKMKIANSSEKYQLFLVVWEKTSYELLFSL